MDDVDASQTVIVSFLAFLLGFVLIGVLSVLKNRHTSSDYLLASQSIKPWLAGLSAVATNNSGWMFVGLIGFTFTHGLSAMWVMIGWITGDMAISFLVHRRLRNVTQERNVVSFGGVLARWHNTDFRLVRILSGLLTLLFLGAYAGAQLNAGSKALHVLLGWDYAFGATIGAVIVLIYCFAGGIRASIWTDAAQAIVMFASMAVMCVMAIHNLGGLSEFWQRLDSVDPHYREIVPHDMIFGATAGPVLFIIGWLFAGIGVIGQPHIMVRFMAMDDVEHMNRARLYYYGWFVLAYILTYGVGLAARLLLDVRKQDFDAELALPVLALQLMPDIGVGLVLAGLFAATMSTADSQILSCSGALTRDLFQGRQGNQRRQGRLSGYWLTKGATVVVTAIALFIALYGADSVFYLVNLSWAALGATFGPLLIVYALQQKPAQPLAVTMMLGGGAATLLWWAYGYPDAVYQILPGIVTGLAIFLVGRISGFAQTAQES